MLTLFTLFTFEKTTFWEELCVTCILVTTLVVSLISLVSMATACGLLYWANWVLISAQRLFSLIKVGSMTGFAPFSLSSAARRFSSSISFCLFWISSSTAWRERNVVQTWKYHKKCIAVQWDLISFYDRCASRQLERMCRITLETTSQEDIVRNPLTSHPGQPAAYLSLLSDRIRLEIQLW